MRGVYFLALVFSIMSKIDAYFDEKEEKLPTKCHVCKHMTRELSEELGRSGKTGEVLYMGQVFQKEPKKVPYKQSELRLVEALENACSNVLDYKVHKDKPLSLRYEKVESMTFRTLKGLKKRGVKVDLGFPDQMWDSPDAEVTRLKNKCEQMVEMYEEEISTWYWNLPDTNLTDWLCVERVLDEGEDDCLNETMPHKDEKNETQIEEKDEKTENKMKQEEKRESGDETKEEVKKKSEKKEKKKKVRKEKKKPKTSEPERNKEVRDEENNDDKIQRLIREQAEEQARGRYRHRRYRRDNRQGSGNMDETKRKRLRDRLLAIRDPERLRREIRKIRAKELTEDEFIPPEPWEDRIDHPIPEEVRRDMRKRRYERLENVEDFRREIEMRVLDLEEGTSRFHGNFAVSDTLNFYLEEARKIQDKKELKKRLEDLNALTAILAQGRERRDEL
ncbi:protein canopy homolog 3-like [Actinia tenebrosa]|uniref:Protein canopy homolog 3-like n=1 Tax=Actinia tenebrosa TaxID=6105 RepID=A0A6P8H821_ACTTE|nr:protein canopy homolog 3-like [Actinia tenebrosa]XP_031551394.1 protein canopy homolog 3-like [Actinia tenebrosa]